MKKKTLALLFAALTTGAATFVSCSSSDDDKTPAVGITAVSVTPAGSDVAYTCVVSQATLTIENTNDSVAWDVADAALSNATVTASATLGASVYYNGAEIGVSGVEVDATQPVTLTAKDASGNSKIYTLKVVKATTATGADMVKKTDSFKGFPTGLIDFDMTVFNGKFYAIVTSLAGETENYQLFNSEDGLNWSEVAYKTDLTGVNLPEAQTDKSGYCIGGEGARLAVFGGRMYVIGGARTQGADKYGNAAETTTGWTGPSASISDFRCFSTADGETFRCDSVGMTYTRGEAVLEGKNANMMLYATGYSIATLGGKMYLKGSYYVGFGQWQSRRSYVSTTDGKNWTAITPTAADESDGFVANLLNSDAFFAFKGKLWSIGGFKNFISADYMQGDIHSSSDGIVWTKEGDLPEGMLKLYHAKAIVADDVVFLVGGEYIDADGSTRVESNKIYRSTDGINWTEVEVPANFTARRNAAGVALGNTAFIFGGSTTPLTGYYGYPLEDGNTLTTDTWIKLVK